MASKRFKRFWLTYGRVSGVAVGFSINRHFMTIDLGFWFIGVEF